MRTTPNLGLTSWNLPDDNFDPVVLDDNATIIDNHDHVPLGQGGQGGVPIPENGLAAHAVTATKIGDAAVITRTLAPKAVIDAKLAFSASVDADRAVGGDHIKTGAVGTRQTGTLPSARTTRTSTAYTAASDETHAIPFTGTHWDTASMWNVSAPTRLTFLVPGYYTVSGHVAFSSVSVSGYYRVSIFLNNGTTMAATTSPIIPSIENDLTVSTVIAVQPNDFIELTAFGHMSSGGYSVAIDADYSPELTVAWLSPL